MRTSKVNIGTKVFNKKNKIQELEDRQAVITSDGRYYETINKQSMKYYYDTHHYAIGVMENE